MKIIHFNTDSAGGSAVLMMRLHQALRQMGQESRMKFRHGEILGDPAAQRIEYSKTPLDRLLERGRYSFENRLVGAEPASYYSRMRLHRGTPCPEPALDGAIIHLHWVGRWLNLPSFVASIPVRVPIIWTVHDMSPLAGGCFTDFGCDEFGNGCRVCPLLKFPFNRIWARKELKRRIRALGKRRVAFVANSQSTMALVERSEVAEGKLQKVIPPGFDFTELKPIPQQEARLALGIPEEAFVLGFGAASLTDENKGINRFYEVAQRVAQEIPHAQALVFGDGEPEEKIPTQHVGIIKDPAQLALAYSAMDVHVVTSQMETFGQVSVEAQACGTPVFAFAVGGLPETLVDGKTGVLVPFGQCEEMAAQIVAAYRAGRLESMGEAGAEWVRGQFDTLVVAKKYVEVYEELLRCNSKG